MKNLTDIKHLILSFQRVESFEHAEILRKVRNECREFMTQNTNFITENQQKEWFKTSKDKYDLYIVYAVEHGAIVTEIGYGVIHKNNKESLITGGLVNNYRNHGLGRDLFNFLIQESKKRSLPIKLEVLKTNIRAINLYQKLGFHVEFETDKLYKMEYKNDSLI